MPPAWKAVRDRNRNYGTGILAVIVSGFVVSLWDLNKESPTDVRPVRVKKIFKLISYKFFLEEV